MIFEKECKEILKEIKKRKIKDQHRLNQLKLEIIKKHKITDIPANTDLTTYASDKERKQFRSLLSLKPTRTISGVAVIAVMTKPIKCPHGKCITCPGGPNSIFGNIPQSYTGKEPATRRAIRNRFDPYLQVFNRLEQYIAMNRIPDKIELIIMGGTFPSFTKRYKEEFITDCFRALNDFSDIFFKKDKFLFDKFKEFFELPGDIDDEKRLKRIFSRISRLKSKTQLTKEQEKNEKAKIRCIGLTIETRPDYGKLKHGNELLRLGCTRIELGVQTVYEDVLKKIERGHTIQDTIDSIRTLKNLGFKLNFHMMLGLPGVDKEGDLLALTLLFLDEDYQPDMLKLYPCMVLKGTKLYKLYKKGKYKPLTTRQAALIIAEFKSMVPKYCRIMRVQRDIPTFMTEAGVDRTNLRQYVEQIMKKNKIKCDCIRCREIGRAVKKKGKINLTTAHYKSSGGNEFFIALESKDHLFGFCRLRFPSQFMRKEIEKDSALIRELHVYGEAAVIGTKGEIQHKGMGKKLLDKAEEIAKTYFRKKMIVISGIGVKEYYKKFGYKKQGPYMVKKI